MKIKRNINGTEVEITLTEEEIFMAGHEHNDDVYREDIIGKLKEMKIPMPSVKKIDSLANMFDRVIRNNDSFWEIYWASCEVVIDESGLMHAFSECSNIEEILLHPEHIEDKEEALVLARTEDDVIISLGFDVDEECYFCVSEDDCTEEVEYPENGESLQDAYKRILKKYQTKE